MRLTDKESEGIVQMDQQCLDANISNLIELHHLSENAVLHILRNRFSSNHIYTFVSSILVAVNPFRDVPIYGQEYVDKYKNSPDKKTLPPHIFATADNAYIALIRNFKSQSIVISGESGAGKTESIKLILKYIAHASRRRTEKPGGGRSIQEQILQANPLMEAFGNAKTSRNNNRCVVVYTPASHEMKSCLMCDACGAYSSRFGKLITLKFSGGAIDEAGIVR
jgi:myosin V